jgi:hypothetical protein
VVSTNELVVDSAYKVLRGEMTVPTEAGYCLQLTRLIVEDACNLEPWGFYKWRTHIVERAPTDDTAPWARDMERSLNAAGMSIAGPMLDPKVREDRYVPMVVLASLVEPGDLLFRWDVARTRAGTFIGHVGILLPGGVVLENVSPGSRPNSFRRNVTSVTPLKFFPVTLAVRFNPG